MGSILTTGAGLDGVRIPAGGPFVALGTINAGSCSSVAFDSKTNQVVTNVIYQDSETDIYNLSSGVLNNSARQNLLIKYDGEFNHPELLVAPAEYRKGDEIALGDQAAEESGDLHRITSQYEVIATGYTQTRDGQWVSPTGAIISTVPSLNGVTSSHGSDNTTGLGVEVYYNYGATETGSTVVNPA